MIIMTIKMFLEEKPIHPELFVALMSTPDFADNLLQSMLFTGINNLNRIWFRECSEKEKEQLIQSEIIESAVAPKGKILVLLGRNEQDFFVNLIP